MKNSDEMKIIKQKIAKATTKEELHAISYEVFLKSGSNTRLDNMVDTLCVKREIELGLL